MAGAVEVAPHAITDPALEPIAEKVRAGERLTRTEGAVLFRTPDVIGRRLFGQHNVPGSGLWVVSQTS